MYLLIPIALTSKPPAFTFTFHNVSINSNGRSANKEIELNLHSIMYLLIRTSDGEGGFITEIYIP